MYFSGLKRGNRMANKFYGGLIIIIFLAVGVFASFDYNGNSLVTSYAEGEIIKGSVNISFNNEKAESMFTSNLDGESSLLDFLLNNSLEIDVDFDCSTPDCETGYEPLSELNQFVLEDERVLGFRVSGNDISSVESAKFRITGNSGNSCINPVFIDILNNNQEILVSDSYVEDEYCGNTNRGCFDTGANLDEVQVATSPYCNKMVIPTGPGIEVGAKIKNTTKGVADLKMELYGIDGDFIDACDLPKHTQIEETLGCVINYSIVQQDEYLVCVKIASATGNPNYKIMSENEEEICGTDNLGISYTRDYDIYMKVLKYGPIDMIVDDGLFNKKYNFNLKGYIMDYIYDNYAGDCQPDCVVPIRFYGGSQVEFSLSDIEFSFKDGNTLVEKNSIYDVTETPALISLEDLILDLSKAGFSVPYDTNQNKFKLYLGGNKIFEEPIEVSESFEFDVNPKFVAFGQSTVFYASASDGNITKTEWKFGDGDEEIVNGNRVTHRYLEQGEFDLEVTATKDGNITGTRTFTILVADAKESARITIDDYNSRIVTVKENILDYPDWFGIYLTIAINVEGIENKLSVLESQYEGATEDENYTEIMLELLELKVPKSINSTINGKLPLVIGYENFNIGHIEDLSGDEVDNDKAEKAILGWMDEYFSGSIGFDVISGDFDSGVEAISTKFEVDVSVDDGVPATSYLIMNPGLDEVTFSKESGQMDVSGATSVKMDTTRKVLEFAMSGEVLAEDLGIYISPFPSELDLEEDTETGEEDEGFKWRRFIIGIIVLIVLAFIAYIIMQEWYKRNYQHHLFRNDNDIYNLINFVYNGRKAGMNDRQIKYKLKQSRWSGEQIDYAIKKLDGKRTRMWEIPLFRGREKKKIKKEIMKRQNPRFAY
ncbi:hypothetical protein COY79_02270 [Candidatus Pacearchaeota archaeon CG_4_10_14_0_8_um_filter_35_169]|nr:MAG: hypothetical protein AUJ63_00655 [Candidatus Pacearchaeota archaeon CG1_02_35_32]PIY81541.1 MAG: hypothetical protein COY79_02270 [Candidatus Pacearchaeota archaeon CG_4_10_14_0_8_um_filter_35_169]PJB94180.1 MAG: hypothetical protein CO081_02435 [Candidatus Pacearchaeota archaeon CG_4_9_14_0_8_um_filter_35_24]